MRLLVYLLPIIAVVLALASRRVSLLAAGVMGLILTLPGVWMAGTDSLPLAIFEGASRGAWIAWQAVSIILGGILLYQVLRSVRPELFAPRVGAQVAVSHCWLFTVCFLLGPFVEAATGFGVGYLITLSTLMRLGVSGALAAAIGLFSQMMVPWGALAVGTYIGADLGDLQVRELGLRSAAISGGLFLGYLVVFWWMLSRAGRVLSWRHKLDDTCWMLALIGLLYLANDVVAVEVAALLSTGPLLVLRYLRDRVPGTGSTAKALSAALPYAALTAILVLTRTLPGVQDWLSNLLWLRPASDLPSFPVFYHASFWLVVVALVYGMRTLSWQQWGGIGRNVWSNARVPVLVSVVFLMMAETMNLAGIPAALAQALVSASNNAALAASPIMALLAGAFTASNTASNGMLMVLQIELARAAGADHLWIAAVQNVAGSNAILLSPVRIAMGCALVGLAGRESEVYASVWPLALVMLVVLEAVCFLV